MLNLRPVGPASGFEAGGSHREPHDSLPIVVCMLVGLTLDGQAGKKVFISVDMEGISGISGSDQLSAAGAEYNRSRKLMADDANAAIRGARAGGATDIVVNDSHGSMRNLRLEDLDQARA